MGLEIILTDEAYNYLKGCVESMGKNIEEFFIKVYEGSEGLALSFDNSKYNKHRKFCFENSMIPVVGPLVLKDRIDGLTIHYPLDEVGGEKLDLKSPNYTIALGRCNGCDGSAGCCGA